MQLLADAGDSEQAPIPVAVETGRGLLAACLRATGRAVYAINPKAVDRYLRTDRSAHRPPCPRIPSWPRPSRSSPAPSRTRCGERTCAHNKLRSLLREYYPGILAAFATKRGGLLRPEARALLTAAPTPRAGARLTLTQLRALLARAERSRGIDAEARRLRAVLRADYLHRRHWSKMPAAPKQPHWHAKLDTAAANAERLAAATIEQPVEETAEKVSLVCCAVYFRSPGLNHRWV